MRTCSTSWTLPLMQEDLLLKSVVVAAGLIIAIIKTENMPLIFKTMVNHFAWLRDLPLSSVFNFPKTGWKSCFFFSAQIFLWFVFATLWSKILKKYNNKKSNVALVYLSRFRPSPPAFCLNGDESFITSNSRLGNCFYFFCSCGYVCFKGSKYGLCSQAWPSPCSADCFAPQGLIKLPIASLHRFITFLSVLQRQRFSSLQWCIKFSLLSVLLP